MEQVFNKYFVGIGTHEESKQIVNHCHLCQSIRKFPKELDKGKPQLLPSHPGSHFNSNIIRRAAQKIMVSADMFSGFVTCALIDTEGRADIVKGLLTTITPVRHSHRVLVRTDKGSSLQSLKNNEDEQLRQNGIELELGHDFNKNSNCLVDKKIQELETELIKVSPEGSSVTSGQLSQAVNCLNSRVRKSGLSASQIHFSRDSTTGVNLTLDDSKIIKQVKDSREKNNEYSARSKAPKGESPTKVNPNDRGRGKMGVFRLVSKFCGYQIFSFNMV